MIEINSQNYKQYPDEAGPLFDSVHDDIMQDMSVDYLKKTVSIICKKTFPLTQKYQMVFHDFIYMNCTCMDFWGKDDRLYYMSIESNPEKTKSFIIDSEVLEKEPIQYYTEKEYINVWLGIMSGDAINIICKRLTIQQI